MTNRLTFLIAAWALGFLVLDLLYDNGDHALFLAKKFMDLLNWAAFWR